MAHWLAPPSATSASISWLDSLRQLHSEYWIKPFEKSTLAGAHTDKKYSVRFEIFGYKNEIFGYKTDTASSA